MKIILFGNVGSGKSSVIKELKKIFSFEVIAIDNFRRKFGDGSKSSELNARENFFAAIKQNQNQFIECIGIGKVADELFLLLQTWTEPIICLTLTTPKEICKQRLEKRIWDIPFPESIEKISSLLERAEVKISNGEIAKQWGSRQNTILLERENIKPTDIQSMISNLKQIIEVQNSFVRSQMNDIDLMLDKTVQNYYGREYQTYQKQVIESNDKFLEDRMMISKLISETNISGNVVDIGSGDCQWFSFFESTVNNYFAIEVNEIALSLAPKSKKITAINRNVFEPDFELSGTIKHKIDFALFSFFFSHFSDTSIRVVLEKMTAINSLIIVDSLWSDRHKERYRTKELKEVRRKISTTESISLPKRFFEYSDIDSLVKPFGYSVTKFAEGNYWFIYILEKQNVNRGA